MALHRSRPVGFGPAPIRMADLAAYLDLCGVADAEARVEAMELLAVMDAAWLQWANDRQAKEHHGNAASGN